MRIDICLCSLIERLENAGWSQEDYKFTREVAREWVVLVESPKLLTDRSA